jgi:hypothetical protein
MSLNRCEQAIFDYWQRHLDEKRHWQSKVVEATKLPRPADETARGLERELRAYLEERSPHVPLLREAKGGATGRPSLLNLAEYLIRLWGPVPKPKRPAAGSG